MTNPNNIVRVRARNGGRASVYEANAWCQSFTPGILEGVGVVQNTSADMNVLVGGSATKPDVLIAQNPAGYKIALDIIGQQTVAISAPASNSRISAIVAYTDDLALATTEDNVTGSPASCGLIVVNGTAAANPTAPTEAQIRTAITNDGATGSQAAYCVIATITVASNTTIITNSMIGPKGAGLMPNSFQNSPIKHIVSSVGYQVGCDFFRLGNIVIASVPNVIPDGSFPTYVDDLILVETIPSGFRPSSPTSINLAITAVEGRAGNASIIVYPDGALHLNTAYTGERTATRLNGVAAWFTNDSFPA